MPLSQDPEKRARQLANLQPRAAAVHGAFVEPKLAPIRERYLTELRAQLPSAGDTELVIQAGRLAQMDVLQQFLDWRGPIRHQRRGDTFPAADLLAKLSSAFERQHERLLERERQSGSTGGDTIDSIAAEYAAKRQLAEGGNGDDC